MEKELIKEEKTAITEDIAQGIPTAREELEALLNEILPQEQRNGDVDAMALAYIRKQKEMNDKLLEGLADDPRFAAAMADVVNNRGSAAASLARYYGKSFLESEVGSDVYNEIVEADKKFNEEREQIRLRAEEYDSNAAKWFDAFDAYCERMNLNADVYKVRVEDEVIIPTLEWEVSDKLFDRLIKAVDYDKDVDDAFAAGEVKGRNENINNLRNKPSDGMPKALGTQAAIAEKPKRKVNSFVASAINA